MTAQLACLMGLIIFGGDPMSPAGPPVAAEVQPGFRFRRHGHSDVRPGFPRRQARPAARRTMPTEYPAVDPVPAGPSDGVQYFNLDELRAEMKKLAWTKGDFTITPYGILWANWWRRRGGPTPATTRSTCAAAGGCRTTTAMSTRSLPGWGSTCSARASPCSASAQSGGKVEIDFQRQIDVENKASLLLRHAYVEVKDDEFRLLVGQTWDVISPLCPGVLFYSVGWDAGNIGYRRPQFRVERYWPCPTTFELIAQGSVNTNAPSDTGGTATTYKAYSSAWPIVEGRLAMRLGPRGPGCLPWEFGVSSHVGELIYDFHRDTQLRQPQPVQLH